MGSKSSKGWAVSVPRNGSGTQQAGAAAEAHAASQAAPPPLFVDAFAGCGGLSLGLMRAGWKGLFAIEKDPFAFDTLSANFPCGGGPLSYDWPGSIERRAWDIRELLSERREALSSLAGKVDLLSGGPPCQGFSQAGRRQPDDPRNKLFGAFLELARILRPRLVLVENVRGFTADFKVSASDEISNFAAALQDGLSVEYDVAIKVLQTRNFGLPQVRSRYFLAGALKSMGAKHQIDTFFNELESHAHVFLDERQLPRSPTARDAISDLEVALNGTVPSADSKGFEATAYKEPLTPYQKAMRDGHEGPPSDMRLARHRQDIRDRFEAIIKACREEGRLNTTISAETRKSHGLTKRAIRVLDPLGPAPTITSLPDDLLHYSEARTLTVRENARLLSFPDWFAFKGKYTTGGHLRRNEVPRFSQVANAIPPLLAEQLGFALLRIVNNFRSTKMVVEGLANDGERPPMRSEALTEVRHPIVIDDLRFVAPE